MALLNLFGKKSKAEDEYFKQRNAASAPNAAQPAKSPVSNRLINKDLISDLFNLIRSHDGKSAITVLANTTDSVRHQAGIMINKGHIPKKIVTYLQDIGLRDIEDTLRYVNSEQPDEDGFFPIDEKKAANLNLPLGCMLYGIRHHIQREFGVILVVKQGFKDRKSFLKKLNKTINR